MYTGPDGKGRDCKSQAVKASEFDSHRVLQNNAGVVELVDTAVSKAAA